MPRSPRSSPRRVAHETLLTMLTVKHELNLCESWACDLRIEDDWPASYCAAVRHAYGKQLARAAKPSAKWLINQGDDIGTTFPFD